jgi:tRNA U34 2-thiouridine synthase MnmA/TrmU
VVEKRVDDNTLVVSHESKPSKEHIEKQTITLREINWLSTRTGLAENITAQIRYHGELIPAKIIDDHTIELSYQGVIALGQSLVLYKRHILIGGGVIQKAQ